MPYNSTYSIDKEERMFYNFCIATMKCGMGEEFMCTKKKITGK